MKTENFRNALNLSAEELAEVAKVQGQICRILEKDFNINFVSVGFEFFEISVYTNYTDCVYRITQDGATSATYVRTSLGLIQLTNEVGEVILNVMRNMQQNDKFINVKLLPL
jgi:hypothetical protein